MPGLTLCQRRSRDNGASRNRYREASVSCVIKLNRDRFLKTLLLAGVFEFDAALGLTAGLNQFRQAHGDQRFWRADEGGPQSLLGSIDH